VTAKTLFQAASISKPVTAMGMLALVQQGKLSLDEDVNAKLKTWKIPENEFTTEQKVTLRRLASHTAGLTVSGFPGYDVDEKLPTLVQIFNGEKPANTPPIHVDVVPGTKEQYSGGGVTIEQQVMMDATGMPFATLMKQLVLDRISMKTVPMNSHYRLRGRRELLRERILTANLSAAGGTSTPRWQPRDCGRRLRIWQSLPLR